MNNITGIINTQVQNLAVIVIFMVVTDMQYNHDIKFFYNNIHTRALSLRFSTEDKRCFSTEISIDFLLRSVVSMAILKLKMDHLFR